MLPYFVSRKRHIAVKNLNESSDVLRKFPRHNKYDVGTAEWNPTSSNNHLCALSVSIFQSLSLFKFYSEINLSIFFLQTNQKIELVCWKEGNLHLAHTLRFHTRLVTDLNWHRFDSNILASASIDTFTHVWDIRDPRKPSITFSAVGESILNKVLVTRVVHQTRVHPNKLQNFS